MNGWVSFRNLGLSDAELQGLAVFNSQAGCSFCHTLTPGSAGYPLFTDFGYDNLGIPKNPANPFYTMPEAWNPDGESWIDYGLGGYLKSAGYEQVAYEAEMGKFKVPTLRNVDLRPSEDFVKAFGHNGYFKSLNEIITFYHWRIW
jgi:cytochrome c peroxidase